jgi:hypothetical protein
MIVAGMVFKILTVAYSDLPYGLKSFKGECAHCNGGSGQSSVVSASE